jgi:uncharacterized protein DUF6798
MRSGLEGNEHLYVLAPYLMADDSLLSADGLARNGLNSKYVYNLIGSWFTHFLDPVSFALVGRSLAIVFMLVATMRLCRTLGFGPKQYALFFVTWYYLGQSWFAAEWMLSTTESKPFSYGLVILALDFLLRGRPYLAAICAGLATSFHVLTGGWAQAALFVSVLLARLTRQNTWRWREVWGFAVVSGLWALPGLIPALRYSNGGLNQEEVDLIFRVVGFHMDPGVWLTGFEMGGFLACWLLTGVYISRMTEQHHRAILLGFQSAVGGLALLGYSAYALDARWFLVYYPFRLADAFWPFMYFLTSISIVGGLFKERSRKDRFSVVVAFFFLLAVVLIVCWKYPHHRLAKNWANVVEQGVWPQTLPAYSWLRDNTNKNDVVLAPPWYEDFWLGTSRPQVFCLKSVPHNRLISEWEIRKEMTLGRNGMLERHSFASFRGKRFFRLLHVGQLDALSQRYDAKYYLTDKERTDLPYQLLYSDGEHWIYKLR